MPMQEITPQRRKESQTVVHASSSKNIFSLSRTHMIMETWQSPGNRIVDHRFITDFGGRVDVALNFGLIKYLQEPWVQYKEQLNRNVVSATHDNLRSPTSPVL